MIFKSSNQKSRELHDELKPVATEIFNNNPRISKEALAKAVKEKAGKGSIETVGRIYHSLRRQMSRRPTI